MPVIRFPMFLDVGDHAWRQRGGLPEGFFGSGEATESAAAITEASTEEVDQRWILPVILDGSTSGRQ